MRREKALYAWLKYLGVQDLGDRQAIQHIVYLLQELGVNFGFRFRWYKEGIYSSELADALRGIELMGKVKA